MSCPEKKKKADSAGQIQTSSAKGESKQTNKQTNKQTDKHLFLFSRQAN